MTVKDKRVKYDTLTNSGAMQMAINALERMNKTEIVDELKAASTTLAAMGYHIKDDGSEYFKIACAAIKYTGVDGKDIVIAGVRHGCPVMFSAFNALQLAGLISKNWEDYKEVQGFLDGRGNFLDRKAAWKVAEMFGQINKDLNGHPSGTLFSEGLY